MKNTSTPIIKNCIAAVLWCWSCLAQADLQCSETLAPNAAIGTISCVNQNRLSEVIFRRMPAWGVNAGLVVIDICRTIDPKTHPNIDKSSPYSWQELPAEEQQQNVPLLEPRCLRRWCTDDYSYFNFSVNALAVYIPPNFIAGVSFAISGEHFAVSCQTVSSAAREDL